MTTKTKTKTTKTKTKTTPTPGTLEIVVLPGRWMYRGYVEEIREGAIVRSLIIRDAWCIRVWGTTRGLGQIAVEGPTPSTVLDYYHIVRVDDMTGVHRILCRQ